MKMSFTETSVALSSLVRMCVFAGRYVGVVSYEQHSLQ